MNTPTPSRITPIDRLHGFFAAQNDFVKDTEQDGTYVVTLERRNPEGVLLAGVTIQVWYDVSHWHLTLGSMTYLRLHSTTAEVIEYGGFMVNVGNLMNAARMAVA